MAGTLKRRETMARILAARGNALVVTGLGSTTYDAFATHDSPLTFYLWGAMGAAAMIGLGLANAQPQRRVLVVTGDGEMLMGLGSLATIGAQRTANLSVVVIDNEHYAETGMQPSHTARGVDLAGIANAAGFAHASTIRTQPELESLVPALYTLPGPVFAVIKVLAEPAAIALPPRDGAYLRSRFRAALLGEARAVE
jgi:thiamine pyrophosphate-dependent acetolactate synthase large subunit-like protein